MPTDTRSVEDATFELDQTHGSKAQLPECPSRMQQIEMGREARDTDGARHREPIFEQRPIERFSIEGDEHRALGDMRGKLVEQRMLFAEVAHEELLDL